MVHKYILGLTIVTMSIMAHNQNIKDACIAEKPSMQGQIDWLIVGAGPAGLITAGVLMDIGVDPRKIALLDPTFEVGRMGQYYSQVESNNKAKEFVAFINACTTFQQCHCPAIEALKKLDPQQPCLLDCVVEPLRCISAYLRTQLVAIQDMMHGLVFDQGLWCIATQDHGLIFASHVVLATGASPRTLNLPVSQNIIPLDYALDPITLKSLVTRNDIIGIVGGAHSAILLLKYLSTIQVKHVYNFYRHSITYAIDEGCWSMDQFGVKGTTGEWAKNVLEKNPPAHITRVQFKDNEQLPTLLNRNQCNKLIYAMGYERNPLPLINGTTPIAHYDAHGMIAPRLFGIGIAFPEHKIDDGNPRYIVGLNCFMDYAQRLIPYWTQDDAIRSRMRAQEQKRILAQMESLLTISVL